MKRYLLILIGTLLAGCSDPKQKLNILVYPQFLDPGIVAEFEQLFDCKVTQDFFDTPEVLSGKLGGGGDALYDVALVLSDALPSLSKRGLLAPLRHENIPNLRNLDPHFINTPLDSGNRFGAPNTWNFNGLYVRRTKNQVIDETFGLIFDPAKQLGPFYLFDDTTMCIQGALRFKGYPGNNTNLMQLQEARDLVLNAKKRALGFANPSASMSRILAREAVLAFAINVEGARGMREDPETYFFVPREGGDIWFDNFCVPARAPHRDLAEKFINYLLDAKVGARVADFNLAATANKAALEFVNPSDRTNQAIYPPPEVMKRLEWSKDLGEKVTKLYDEIWTQIKSK